MVNAADSFTISRSLIAKRLINFGKNHMMSRFKIAVRLAFGFFALILVALFISGSFLLKEGDLETLFSGVIRAGDNATRIEEIRADLYRTRARLWKELHAEDGKYKAMASKEIQDVMMKIEKQTETTKEAKLKESVLVLRTLVDDYSKLVEKLWASKEPNAGSSDTAFFLKAIGENAAKTDDVIVDLVQGYKKNVTAHPLDAANRL